MRQVYEHFGLDENTANFTGHAMGLQRDDAYLDAPALSTVQAIKMYCYSLERYGKSPYIYPMYGLGGLPEGFSRLCAIHGGTFMLQCPVEEVLFNDAGEAWGIRATLDGQYIAALCISYMYSTHTNLHSE
jgi:Rab GDP dissociation inhibitor